MARIKSLFFKNVLTLFKGNVLFQLTIILTLIFLARHYSVEQIGRYAVFISIISIISTIAPGRLEMAIMLPKEDKKAFNIFISSLLIIFLVSFIFLLVSFFFSMYNVFFTEANGFVGLVVFFGIIFAALTLLQIQYLNRFERFNIVSNGKILVALIISFLQILSVFYFKSVFSLVLAYTIGFFAGSAYYYFKLKSNTKNHIIDFNAIKPTIAEYKKFPTLNSASSLFNIIANQGPVIFIEVVYGSAISGFYSVVQRTLNAPTSLIGSAFSQVFYKKITGDLFNNHRKFMISCTKYLFIIGVLIFIAVQLLSNELYVIVFGEEYIESAKIAKVIVVFFIMRLIFVSQNAFLIAKGKLGKDLGFNIIYLFSMLLPILFCSLFNIEWYICVIIITVTGTLTFLYLAYLLFKKSNI